MSQGREQHGMLSALRHGAGRLLSVEAADVYSRRHRAATATLPVYVAQNLHVAGVTLVCCCWASRQVACGGAVPCSVGGCWQTPKGTAGVPRPGLACHPPPPALLVCCATLLDEPSRTAVLAAFRSTGLFLCWSHSLQLQCSCVDSACMPLQQCGMLLRALGQRPLCCADDTLSFLTPLTIWIWKS